ncbi:MAG: hypothetical protein IJW29_00315 [Clostridia bacterium]|nr:hypothetical protein [Clostridia bacterium]
MGFGYLFIGYLVTFVLYMTVNGLGFGGLALLVGYAVMLYALWQLNRYHRAFAPAKWLTLPLLATALLETVQDLDNLFSLGLPLYGETLSAVLQWGTLTLIVAFHFALLFAIRALATEVGLLHIATAAVRNALFVALYALLSLVANLPIAVGIKEYLTLPVVLVDIVWIVCNLFLLISCTKNICPAGEEDVPEKRSRFEWLNRIHDTYERNRQKSIDNTTREAEEVLRRRKENRERKKNKSKKKKK